MRAQHTSLTTQQQLKVFTLFLASQFAYSPLGTFIAYSPLGTFIAYSPLGTVIAYSPLGTFIVGCRRNALPGVFSSVVVDDARNKNA